MLARVGHVLAAMFRRVTPDPFVLAIGLCWVAFGAAVWLTPASPVDALRAFGQGFFSLLAFTMQMLLILVTGHALASAGPVSRALDRLARLPRSERAAVGMVAAVAIAAALLNWGLGLVVGALLCRKVSRALRRRGRPPNEPLLAAAGYSGMMCWHGGLSGSVPLKVSTAADLAEVLGPDLAARVAPVAFGQSVLGIENLIITGGLWVLLPLVCAGMVPTGRDAARTPREADDSPGEERAAGEGAPERSDGLAGRRRHGSWAALFAALPLLGAFALFVWDKGIDHLNPNALNLAFLFLGLSVYRSPRRYARALAEAMPGATGMVLQFPFYAGVMGIMRETGIAASLATALTSAASAAAYPVTTFLSAGVVNLFVPSGGGQWAMQGPVALSGALALDVPVHRVVMAVAYGDQWTNMLQPFWALPLLSITGVRARDVLGYTSVLLVLGGAYIVVCLLGLPSVLGG